MKLFGGKMYFFLHSFIYIYKNKCTKKLLVGFKNTVLPSLEKLPHYEHFSYQGLLQ